MSQWTKMNISHINAKKMVLYAVFAIFLLATLFPFYWIFVSSITPVTQLFQTPPAWFPANPTMSNYGKLVTEIPVGRYFTNSLILALGSAVVSVSVSFMAAYAFARLHFRGSSLVFIGFLISSALPQIITIVPLFDTMRRLGLVNTHLGLIFLVSSLLTPFTIWVLVSFIKQIPVEIEEGAMIDGASRPRILLTIVLPLLLPAIAAVVILNSISAWNELLYPLVFATTKSTKTLSLGLLELAPASDISLKIKPWDTISALTGIMLLPTVLVVFLFQRYIISGLTRGAIK